MKVAVVSGLLFLVSPWWAHAAITINEVAWMGDANSANHEWIELHNSGAAVDVTGWLLQDGMNLNISLEGVVPADSYVVLERTSDESATGVAFLIYSGALVNTGAILTLRRADGGVEDQVAGGEGWQNIGGDNATKETAQYTTKGWITATATPGAENATESTTLPVESVTKENRGSSKFLQPVKKQEVSTLHSDNELQITVDAPQIGYVNQTVEFSAIPNGIGKTIIDSLMYQWNFGDTTSREGKAVSHTFSYPGTYVVTVEAKYSRHDVVTRHEITVLPVRLSITQNSNGDVQINNDSQYELDLSGYRLKGSEEILFPSNSFLLPNQTITVSRDKLKVLSGSLISLYDTTKTLAASNWKNINISEVHEPVVSRQTGNVSYSIVSEAEQFGFSAEETLISEEDALEIAPSSTVRELSASIATPVKKEPIWPYIALIMLIGTAVVGVVLKPKTSGTNEQ